MALNFQPDDNPMIQVEASTASTGFQGTKMNTLIEHHPVVFFGIAMVIAILFAIFYVALSADAEPDLSWFASVVDSGNGMTLATFETTISN